MFETEKLLDNMLEDTTENWQLTEDNTPGNELKYEMATSEVTGNHLLRVEVRTDHDSITSARAYLDTNSIKQFFTLVDDINV